MSSTTIRVVLSAYFVVSFFFPYSATANNLHGSVVTKDQRRSVVATEFGAISAVKVSDGRDGFYHLQFITMEPNSLFVPAHLHSDMVFYVNSGSGTLSWVDLEKGNDKLRQVELRTGGVYRLRAGSFFYLQSNLESERQKFRINAIFSDSKEEIREGSSFGAYSSVADLLLGFDDKVLQAALNVNAEVIEALRSGGRQQMIVHGVSNVSDLFEVHYSNMRAFLGFIENGVIEVNKKKKDEEAYNILEAKHDFENCNGWSLVVTSKQMKALKDSDFGIFMVNLTKGAMMGPHWNPLTAEIAVVLSGHGMVHVVCPSSVDGAECKNSRFRVAEGDVFVVPRYHPMAQMSFNNGSFVFMGFTTTQKNNHPQYLVGSASVFQVLDRRVLAASLGVSNMTMDEILSAQKEGVILECTSCAEEEERLLEEEIQRKKEEEERKKEEEEAKEKEEEARREEEEARKREEEEAARREEEEARKREEEEARREQEEARKREEEEAAKREEEEARKREEEEARREEEEARKREEEEAVRREEEEARKREEEEEAARKREEEQAVRREEEEARKREEAARRREEEEAAKRRQEKEAARQQEEDRRRQEEEAARKQEEAAAMRQQEEEEAARRQQEEEEAAGRQQEEEEEAARRQHEQEEAARQQEEAMRRRQEHDASRRQEEARRHEEEEHRGGGGSGQEGEGEAASKQEEGMARREKEAEAGREAAGGQKERM